MTDKSKPTNEWTYRNFLCRYYQLGDIGTYGYVRVGDVWKQVFESNDDEIDARSFVEEEVDSMIDDMVSDDDTPQYPIVDPVPQDPYPIDPGPIDPGPDDPGPLPDPVDPQWSTGTVPYLSGNHLVRLETSGAGDSTVIRSLSEIDSMSIDDNGRYIE